MSHLVFLLLEWADRRGILVELLDAAARARPERADLAEFVGMVKPSLSVP
jgi:hypothetical protein